MKKLLLFASVVTLLASCSKEMTSESTSTPAAAGKSTIYADFTVGNPATKTHAEVGTTGFKYIWDVADAIGVLTKSGEDEEERGYVGPNAFFKYIANKEFEGDVELFNAEDYIAYYPYSVNIGTFFIPENQNYNFKGGEFGSFAQGVAPAIALGKTVDDKATFEFKALSSFVVLPIRGLGDKVKKVQLELGDENNIAGTITMNTDELETISFEEVFENLDDLNDPENESAVNKVFSYEGSKGVITLNCGTGVTLNPDKPIYFWFVVPAGADLTDKMTIRVFSVGGPEEGVVMERSFVEEDGIPVTMNGEAIETTHRNYAHILGPNAQDDWFYNPTGSFLVKDEADFLMYAYAVTKGESVWATYENDMAACGMLYGEDDDNEGNLRPALIVSTLDFDNYYEKINESWSEAIGKYSGYKRAVLEAYLGAKGVIPTIGGDKENSLAYSITGSVDGGNAAEIKGLQIKGDGMFGGKAKAENIVSNLILTNIDVDGKYLVTNYADAPFSSNQSTPFSKFEKITVNGGTINGPFAEGEEAAVVNNAYTRNLDRVTVTSYPNEGTALYANTLRVSSNVTKPIASSVTFGKVVGVNSGKGKVVTVAEDGVEQFIEKIDFVASGNNWFSVVTREEADEDQIGAVNTSYWTGFVANTVNSDRIYTAEEYAYDVTNATGTLEIKLTNNLDLRDKVRPEVAVNASVYILGENKAIRNVVITEEVEEGSKPQENYYYTMFGSKASAKDLALENVTIKVVDGAKKAYVATLANTWVNKTMVSENVDVKGLTIIIPETATVSNEIGGLYRNVSLSDAEIDLGGMLGSTVEFAADGEQYGKNEFGYIAGRITLTATTADVSILGETEVETPFAKVYVNVTEIQSGVHGTNLTFAGLTKDQVLKKNVNLNVKVEGISNHTLWVYFGDDEEASYYLKASYTE